MAGFTVASAEHPAFDKARLAHCIEAMHPLAVAVVGDFALDEMVYGQVDRLSREAPVIILRHQETKVILGAAANAAHNIAKLGGKTSVFGVCGQDTQAASMREAFEKVGIQHQNGLRVDATRPTTTKSRISGRVSQSITQQMLRLDRESREPISASLQQQLLQVLQQQGPFKAVLLSDYGLGVFQEDLAQRFIQHLQSEGALVTVDSQSDLRWFKGATIITPNQPEAEQNLGRRFASTQEDWLAGSYALLQQCQTQNLLITRGQDGMCLLERTPDPQGYRLSFLPVFNPSEVFDVTGAGDTVVGTLTLALAAGASLLEAAILGNLAASLVVRQYGCATVSPHDLQQALASLDPAFLSRVETHRFQAPIT
jgi:D-glycero-beta-D-manno-heptose-7-phosphate kinase